MSVGGNSATREELIELIGRRVENLYAVHRLCCSESIILAFSKAFGSRLPDDVAVSLGSGLCGGMGCGDSVCGALSGAVVALGHSLGPGNGGSPSGNATRRTSHALHDRFKRKFGSILCRDLTEEFRGNRKGRLRNCRRISTETAKCAAGILLSRKPELEHRADLEFLRAHETRAAVLLHKFRLILPGRTMSLFQGLREDVSAQSTGRSR